VVPVFRYHWGVMGEGDSTLRAVAVTAGGAALPVRTPREWSSAVGRIGWAPASFRQAVVACAEAARAAGAAPREEVDLYLGPRIPAEWPRLDPAGARRLQPPRATRRAYGQWIAEVWMGEARGASRYRCLFAPRVGRRGPLAEFVRTDSIRAAGAAGTQD
jgi:hypothetical protein